MKHKNLHTAFDKINLLNNLEFILHLKFEVTYASRIRGGHFPLYISERLKKRLVSPENILSSPEQETLSQKFPILPN